MKQGIVGVNRVFLLVALATLGCGTEGLDGNSVSESMPLDARLSELDRDLSVGSSGEQVLAVHDYLTKFGYLPNADLAEEYPAWRPAVAEAPKDPAVFDDTMSEAIRAFQTHTGLIETGIVDDATRAMLRTARCGVPDGAHEHDPTNKFALTGSKWAQSNLTFRVLNTNDVTLAQAQTAAANAFASWAAQTSKTFTQVFSGTADIQIEFAAIDGLNGVLASAWDPAGGGDITIDTGESWSVANPTPAGKKDLQTVILHESGHSLGLHHSSLSGTTMFPNYGGFDRVLATDDNVGISSLYDTWQLVPSVDMRDIGVSSGGVAWGITASPTAGGFTIRRWNGVTWAAADGGAVTVAVEPGGVPWVVNNTGNIFRRLSASAGNVGWELKPGCARDIGIGANGSVWIIGCAAVAGGFSIHKWNGASWDNADGGASRIAVGPTGIPWVVNNTGVIFRRLSSAAGTVGWQGLTGCARDIGISVHNYAWVIGCAPVGGGFAIQVWNEQPAATGAPAAAKWVTLAGGAVAISVGPMARPWVVNNGGDVLYAAP